MPQDCQDRISRPVFFDRQSLTRDDLNAVVDYVRERSRRHNRAVIGHGVTCGLTVQPVPGQPWHLQIGPGHAILPSGEEVAVPAGAAAFDICAAAQACLGLRQGCVAPLDLAAAPLAGAGGAETFRSLDFTSFAPDTTLPNPIIEPWATVASFTPGGMTDGIRTHTIGGLTGLVTAPMLMIEFAGDTTVVEVRLVHGGRGAVVAALTADGVEQDRQSPTAVPGVATTLRLTGAAIRRIVVADGTGTAALLGVTLPATARGEVYLALFPAETPARFQPAIPDRCGPPGNDLLPTRYCEDYRLAIRCDLPPGLAAPDCATVNRVICGPDHVPCPQLPAAGDDCVILATIRCGDFGILSVDEFTHRRRLLPNWLLSQAEACACKVAVPEPTPPPTPTPTPPPTPTPTPPPSIFTRTPNPTQFTVFTRFTEEPGFTIFTGLTRFTDFTRPTIGTLPTVFSFLSIGPDGPGPLGPFDDVLVPVTEIEGIGPVLGTRLRTEGISTADEFLATDTVELSRIMGVSEVRVAEMQLRARVRLGRGGPV